MVRSRVPLLDRLDDSLPPAAYALFALATLLGAAHHVDHVLRGNHVGWPVTGTVTPFTYSLGIYPPIVLGVWLALHDRASAAYWAVVLAGGTVMVAWFHLGPRAVEPPADVIEPYASPLAGYAAFAVLLALLGVVAVGAGYTVWLWRRGPERA
jgi:hypothetical protein